MHNIFYNHVCGGCPVRNHVSLSKQLLMSSEDQADTLIYDYVKHLTHLNITADFKGLSSDAGNCQHLHRDYNRM